MPKGLKYIADKNGHKEAVIVPIQVWGKLNASYRKLQHKLKILKSIRQNTDDAFEKGVKIMYEEYRTSAELIIFT